jgi:hypothetical protein
MSDHPKLSYHPLPLIAFAIWVLCTASVIFMLEFAISHPKHANSQFLRDAPGIFITLFTQWHVPITGMYLGRLGVSALQHPGLAPRTWLEALWFTKKQWQTPDGWGATVLAVCRRRIRISITSFLFIWAALATLPAPILLERAYPADAIEAAHSLIIPTLSLALDTSNKLDPYTQVNIGQTGWASGLSVQKTYPTLVYTPSTSNLDDDDIAFVDVFLSADIDGYDGVLPGLRVQGGCQPLDTHSMDLGPDPSNATRILEYLCSQQNLASPWSYGISDISMSMSLEFGICHSLAAVSMEDAGQAYWNGTPDQVERALIWTRLSDYSNTSATEGFIQCNSGLTSGIAQIRADLETGYNLNGYSEFAAKQLFEFDKTADRVPFWPPLFTALDYITLPMTNANKDTDPNDADVAQTEPFISQAKMIGYTLSSEWHGDAQLYQKPTLNYAALALWEGALHMSAAINVGASTLHSETLLHYEYVPWPRRSTAFFIGMMIVLGLWLLTIIILTALLYRPTSAGDMGSHTFMKICAGRPDLIEAACTEHPYKNVKMLEPYLPELAFGITPPSASADKRPEEKESKKSSFLDHLPVFDLTD